MHSLPIYQNIRALFSQARDLFPRDAVITRAEARLSIIVQNHCTYTKAGLHYYDKFKPKQPAYYLLPIGQNSAI